DELETRIAMAKKTTEVRSRVAELSSHIQIPESSDSSAHFKAKFILHQQALQLLASAQKKNIIVTMFIIHIDRFSQIQSKLGYLASQEILSAFTEFLEKSVRKDDMIIPSSDGQFIVLLPGTKLEDSKPIAEKLRGQIDQQRFSVKQGPIHLTAS